MKITLKMFPFTILMLIFLICFCAASYGDGMNSDFAVTEIRIDSPVNGILSKQHQDFYAHAFIKGRGTGIITGLWYLDDMPLDYFQANMTNGVTVETRTTNSLFTSNLGPHKIWIKITAPGQFESNNIFYTVSEMSTNTAKPATPNAGKVFASSGAPPVFTWTSTANTLGYKIAIVKDTGLFDEPETVWNYADTNAWIPDKDFWEKLEPGTYYWAVKVVGADKQEYPMSKVSYFKITN